LKKILYCQTIFCPDKLRCDRNLIALGSFKNFVEKYDNEDIYYYFGGFGKDEYFKQVKDAIRSITTKNKIEIFRFPTNVGKAITVNKMIESVDSKLDITYLWLSDYDIIIPEEADNYFEHLITNAEKSEEVRRIPFGMAGLNQLIDCCHFKSCWENEIKINENEKIVWPSVPSGIAGGSIFTTLANWKLIGGYRVQGVYCGDDAYYLIDTYRFQKSWQVFDKIGIIHTKDTDPAYIKWKGYVCQRNNTVGFSDKLEDHIKEANEFWSKYE
jgi:hypothetical protein